MNTAYLSTPANPDTTPIATRRNPKSGSKVAAEIPAATFVAGQSGGRVAADKAQAHSDQKSESWAGRWSNLSTDHVKRWEKRLYPATSGGVQLGKLAVRIQHLGHREEFRFDTTNRQAAAVEAVGIFRHLKTNGWEATLAKFKPDCEAKLDLTLGDYLTAVRDLNCLRLRTYLNYANCLRTIAAETLGVKPDKGTSKFDYRSADDGQSGNARWLAKIDAHRLEHLTAERVTAWKRKRIAKANNSPAAEASAKRTVNSYIRCARSLFTPAILKELKGLTLPAPLPFAGVELEEQGSTKYISKLNVQLLIAAARHDLKAKDPEAYKCFLLGLFAGLRKAEIDLLEWRMLDFAGSAIRLEQTEWLHLKTNDSAAGITVDPEVSAELREFMAGSTSPFVISSDITWKVGKKQRTRTRAPRNDSSRSYYRSAPVFDRLNEWLRGKGITANKPLHELRKELGAIIATEQGIYAASRFLRHSDIGTTARHYADGKARINVGLGKYLTPSTEPLTGQAAAQMTAPAAVAAA